MIEVYDKTAVPQMLSLGINRDLLAKAKKLNLNLKQALEKYIIEEIVKAEKDEWLAQNLHMIDQMQKSA
ncbi:MAG: hypothetical protein HKN88_00190 [Gammaproteobacteria bacterium]|nr:type II toxin-antitoxin system CcdA family antitoxin [Gammaproteobacteria bacterium]NNC96468.1 hypothetical protein [Gammaproteobacteria bacterium]NNM14987.1 hypothetical protein [Gammaproteobacteria bacterium]